MRVCVICIIFYSRLTAPKHSYTIFWFCSFPTVHFVLLLSFECQHLHALHLYMLFKWWAFRKGKVKYSIYTLFGIFVSMSPKGPSHKRKIVYLFSKLWEIWAMLRTYNIQYIISNILMFWKWNGQCLFRCCCMFCVQIQSENSIERLHALYFLNRNMNKFITIIYLRNHLIVQNLRPCEIWRKCDYIVGAEHLNFHIIWLHAWDKLTSALVLVDFVFKNTLTRRNFPIQ